MNTKHDYSIDLIRVLGAIGIILLHYYHYIDTRIVFYNHYYQNGDFGNVIVYIFFMISGAMLYYNNGEIKSIKLYYYKRFKSIFPMFYFVFITLYIYTVIRTGNFLYGGNPLKILLTVFGLDGFFHYLSLNYYLIGEWFLGAIIILYAIYPLLLKLFKKSLFLTTTVCILLYSLVFIPNLFIVDIENNILSCLLSFEIGMLIMKYNNVWKENKLIFVISFVLSLIIIFIKIDFIHTSIFNHILAITLFFVLHFIGKYIMKIKILRCFFSQASRISFAIYLLHHFIIIRALKLYMPENSYMSVIYVIIVICVIMFSAFVLNMIIKYILNTKIYLKFENKICNKN